MLFAEALADPPRIRLDSTTWRAGLLQSQWQGDGAPDWETPLPVGTPERTPGASMADIYVNYSTISSTGFQNPWTDRTTYFTNPHNMFGYSGQMWMKGGTTYVLAKNFLTLSMISVDGVPLVPASSSSVGVAAMTPTEDGWHDLDIRLYNQYAQAGPSSYNWNGAHGLGWNTNGVPSTTASLSKEGWNWFTLDGTDDEPMTLFRCQMEESFASIVSVALGENAILVDVEAGPDADVSATVFCDANFGEVGSPESWGIVSDIVPIPAGETRTVSVPWTGESTEPIISLRATGTHAGAFEQWSDILPVSERPVASALVTDVAYTNATVAVSIPYLGLGASSAQWEVRVCTDPDFSEDILRFPSQETITDGETASVPVNGLATNTVYYLCVAVENDLEEVSFSPSVSFRTLNPGHAEGNAQLRSRGFTAIHAFATVADFGDGSEWAKARLEASEDPAFAELTSVSDEEDVLSDSGQLLAVSGLSGGTEYHLRVRFVNEWGLVSFVDLGSVWTRDIPISASGIGHQFPTDGLTMDVSFAVIEVFDDAICTATLFLDGREVGPQAFTEAGTFVWSGIPSSEQSAEARIVVSASVGNDTFEATWMSTIEPGTTTVAVSAVENHLSAGTAVRLRRGDSIQLPELVGSSAYEVLNPRFAALDGNVLTALEPGIVGVRCIDAASETNTLAVLVLPDAIGDGNVYVFKEGEATTNYANWETPSLWEKIGSQTNDSWPHEPDDIAILPFYAKSTFRAMLSSGISLGALYIGSFKDSESTSYSYYYIDRTGSVVPTISFARSDGGTALLQSCPNTTSNRIVAPAFQNVRIKYNSDTVIDGGWSGIVDNYNRGIASSLFAGSVTNVVSEDVTLSIRNVDGTGQDMGATFNFYVIEGSGTIWNRSHGSVRFNSFSPDFTGTIRDSSHLAGMTQRQGPTFIRNRFPNAISEAVGYVPTSAGRPAVNNTGVGVVATGWGSSGYNGTYYGNANWFTANGIRFHGGIWAAWHTGDLASGWTAGEIDRKLGETFSVQSGFSVLSKTTGGKPINWIECNSLAHADKGSLLIVDPSRATVASTSANTNSVTILRGWENHAVGAEGDCEATASHPVVPWIVSPTSSQGVNHTYSFAFASFDATNRLVRPLLRESAVAGAGENENVLSANKTLTLTEDVSVNSLVLHNTTAAQRMLGAGRKLAIVSGGLFLGGNGTSIGLPEGESNGSLVLGDETHPAYVWAASTSATSPNQIWADVIAPGGFVSAYTGWLVLGGNQTNIADELVVNAGTMALGTADAPCLLATGLTVRIFANATLELRRGDTLLENEIQFDGAAGCFGHVDVPAGVTSECVRAFVRDYPESPEWAPIPDGLYSGDEETARDSGAVFAPEFFSGQGLMRIGRKPGLTVTQTTPIPVPYVWLEAFPEMLAGFGGDYEAFGNAMAANGRPVWECYVAGLCPTNATDRFLAMIEMDDGEPVVRWTPDLNEDGTKHERVYTVEGKTNLGDELWGPTNAASRFFRVKVGMP